MSSDEGTSRLRILRAALALITRRGGAAVTMAEIAKAAKLSRQALYLHFQDRADLLMAVVSYVDEQRGLTEHLQKVFDAPTGVAALREAVKVQARLNPSVWPIARALDAVRRTDEAAERAWQDRLARRLDGCRRIVARMRADRTLRKDLSAESAADLLWTMTSLRTWEDLVLSRGWSADNYERLLTATLLAALTK